MTLYKFIAPSIIREHMMENTELIRQFLELYQNQLPQDFQALKEAVTAQEHSAIAKCAHHIKPTMEYIGARELRIRFQELENDGKFERNVAEIQQKFTNLEEDMKTLLQEISDYRDTL